MLPQDKLPCLFLLSFLIVSPTCRSRHLLYGIPDLIPLRNLYLKVSLT